MTRLQFAEEFRDQFTAERLECTSRLHHLHFRYIPRRYMDAIEDTIRNSVDERYKKGLGPSGEAVSRECVPDISTGAA